MWMQVAYKELRETAWIAGLALLLQLWNVVNTIGIAILPWVEYGDYGGIPFVGGPFYSNFAMAAAALAIALGFAQTSGESIRGTWLFLLHRPAPWWNLIGLKLLTGAVLYFVATGLPILIYALWAATPQTHPGPFYWSMTLPAWATLLTVFPVYLAAFLSGLRPARWFGTRLLPLAAGGFLVALAQVLPWWWLLGIAALVVLAAWIVLNIFTVVRTRDYP